MPAFVALEISRIYAPGHGPGLPERTLEFLFMLVPGVPAAGPFLVGSMILCFLMVRTSRRTGQSRRPTFDQPTDWSHHLGIDTVSARVKRYIADRFG